MKQAYRGPASKARRMTALVKRLMDQVGAENLRSVAIQTSFRNTESPEQNRKELKEFRNQLKAWGCPYRDLLGYGQQNDGTTALEPSHFIQNITFEQAKELWKRHQQWGIIYIGDETQNKPLMLGGFGTPEGYVDEIAEFGEPEVLTPKDEKPKNWSGVPTKRNKQPGHGFVFPWEGDATMPGHTSPRNTRASLLQNAKLNLEGVEPVLAILQSLTSQTMALSMRSHEAHWNVKGPNFGPLHELFGDFYDFTNDWVDTLAERVVQQGGVAQALSTPWEPKPLVGDEHALLTDVAMMANALVQQAHIATVELNEATEDESTKDILIEFTRELEKWVWKIESHLQGYQKVASRKCPTCGH